MKPKVSIIVPCYGVEKYLDRCMESLVNQTLRDIEIILVDDVSPDRVPEMCDEWAKKDNRIKVIHKEKNGGLGYARNTGLDVASGEYVAFIDSDDYVDVSIYEKLYTTSTLVNADCVLCGFNRVNNDGTIERHQEVVQDTTFENTDVQTLLLDMIACAPCVKKERLYEMCVWRGIYKRDIIENKSIRFQSEREIWSEDIPFDIAFFKNAEKVVFLSDCLHYYCVNNESLTATFYPEKIERAKKLRDVIISELGSLDSNHERANRLFIGYIRSLILLLMRSNVKNRKSVINKISSDEIWTVISKEYKPNNLNGFPKIHYTLLLKRRILFLITLSYVACFIKRLLNKTM